jgi:hypothetical protein
MQIKKLLKIIRPLPDWPPLTRRFYTKLYGPGAITDGGRTPRQHLLGFWGEYETYGAYGRRENAGYDARFAFNHFRCAPDLFWLAEVAGVQRAKLTKSGQAILEAPDNDASEAAAFRRIVSWDDVEAALMKTGRIAPNHQGKRDIIGGE